MDAPIALDHRPGMLVSKVPLQCVLDVPKPCLIFTLPPFQYMALVNLSGARGMCIP